MDDLNTTNQESRSPNLRDQILQYLRYWSWFLLTVILALGVATVYLRYATTVFSTKATILIKDEKNSALSEMAAFQDLGLTGSMGPSGFENELQILKSKSLTERVVKELDLNIQYFSEGKLKAFELFGNIPFQVTLLTNEDSLRAPIPPFYVLPISDDSFELWEEDSNSKNTYSYGENISLTSGEIMISPNLKYQSHRGSLHESPIKVRVRSILGVVEAYQRSIQVEQVSKLTSVIRLSINSANYKKSEAILNELIYQYNKDAKEDRNMVSKNTANFIDGRLEIISEELDSVETGRVEFQQSNKLTNIAVEGQIFLQNESEFAKRTVEVETKLELINTIIDYVKSGRESDLLPTNLGVEGEAALTAYNQAVLERKRLLRGSTEKNPAVVDLDAQISDLRSTVLEGLNNAKRSLEIQRDDLSAQEARLDSKISSIPPKEKIFRNIIRQQEIKETLYLYLLQKREENAITMAVTTPKAKVVDYAYTSRVPISPKRQIIYQAAFVLGLLVPFSVIYLKNLLDNKIRSKYIIEKRVKDNPVIGEIPKLDKNAAHLVQKNDRSLLAESFRLLTTNLQYLFIGNSMENKKGKTIFVTSTIKGEGKTFTAVNLALTIADSGAKVVLVGADIRNPQLQRYTLEGHKKRGFVEYLIHKDSNYQEYLIQSDILENLEIMFSGTIPPNPAKLLIQPRVEQLFKELREEFDYIVVDTAPSMIVTDTFLINKYTDVTLFVMRAGYTDTNLIDFAVDSINSKKLKNVGFVLNDVDYKKIGYGNRYEYYYVKEETWWEKFKTKF
ncbi:MAG TPA: polysaccharide biosynthesis tyrosine autokinase [Aequorivita sp.]|nr:polysaccharide biosynthesis tyrosine autokinase [Aequorivita sp.]